MLFDKRYKKNTIFISHKIRKSIRLKFFIRLRSNNSSGRYLMIPQQDLRFIRGFVKGKKCVLRYAGTWRANVLVMSFSNSQLLSTPFFFARFLHPSFPLINLPLEKRAAKRTRILIFLAQDGEIAITTSGAIEIGLRFDTKNPF